MHFYSAPYQFDITHVCCIIPAYNNAATVAQVAQKCLQQLPYVMVVNDGSTDDTLARLEPLKDKIILISYADNKGKGGALRTGMRKAREMGFRYALTIDADGQHLPEDIPALINRLKEHPDSLIVGKRTQRGQTRGAKFANRFSNFWFAVQTLHRLKDTQTGLRIYPLLHLPALSLLTSRYEAELELLVWSAWRGVNIQSVPVNVYYPPREERISHFQPAKDFTRISIFNTIMLVGAFLYGYPSMALRWLWRQEWAHYPHVAFKWLVFALDVLFILVPASFFYFLFKGNNPQAQEHYHRILQRVALHPIDIKGYFKAQVHNDVKEDFSKPAMIICNHQSMVDILTTLSLTPKLIMLAKPSYAHHPILAPILHFAGFYTVSEGYEQLTLLLQEKVKQGYSVCVFPEGTRTRTGKIQRFHRGAFYLAEQLNLDIVPCLMENSYQLWPKGCYFPHKGIAHMQVMPRIPADDTSFGEGFRHRAKQFERYYRQLLEDKN